MVARPHLGLPFCGSVPKSLHQPSSALPGSNRRRLAPGEGEGAGEGAGEGVGAEEKERVELEKERVEALLRSQTQTIAV